PPAPPGGPAAAPARPALRELRGNSPRKLGRRPQRRSPRKLGGDPRPPPGGKHPDSPRLLAPERKAQRHRRPRRNPQPPRRDLPEGPRDGSRHQGPGGAPGGRRTGRALPPRNAPDGRP